MSNKYFRYIFIIFLLAFSLPAHAVIFPVIGGCDALHSKDLSTQMGYEFDSRINGVTASDTTKSLWTSRGNGVSG